MKKILFLFPVLLFLATGCNSQQNTAQLNNGSTSIKQPLNIKDSTPGGYPVIQSNSDSQSQQNTGLTQQQLESMGAQPVNTSPTNSYNTSQSILTSDEINTITTNYKQDAEPFIGDGSSLVNYANNDGYAFCSFITQNKESRNHPYYKFSNWVIAMETKYSIYDSQIPYILNDIQTQYSYLKIIQDTCNSYGYDIGY